MPREPEYAGPRFSIVSFESADGACPVGEFLDGLAIKDRVKVQNLFHLLGDTGRISNQEKFKKLEGTTLFEFKSFQIRIICAFLSGKIVLLLHGVMKKGNRIKAAELRKAETRLAEHLNERGM
jgi:hypothetical protein